MWVGQKPNNKLWIDDLNVEFKDATPIPKGWRANSYSDYFELVQMRESGECWADCDAVALREWPDQEWMIIPAHPNRYASFGVLRIPAGHPVIDCTLGGIRRNRPNAKALGACLQKYNIPQTHDRLQFYPISCTENSKMRGACYKNLDIPEDTYSYHFFHITRERNVLPQNSYYEQLCERFL